MNEEMTYKEAIGRLKEIVGRIDTGELDIDELTGQIKEAKQLLAFCNEKLTHAGKEVEILLSEE